jgi:hypothetical protein
MKFRETHSTPETAGLAHIHGVIENGLNLEVLAGGELWGGARWRCDEGNLFP